MLACIPRRVTLLFCRIWYTYIAVHTRWVITPPLGPLPRLRRTGARKSRLRVSATDHVPRSFLFHVSVICVHIRIFLAHVVVMFCLFSQETASSAIAGWESVKVEFFRSAPAVARPAANTCAVRVSSPTVCLGRRATTQAIRSKPATVDEARRKHASSVA